MTNAEEERKQQERLERRLESPAFQGGLAGCLAPGCLSALALILLPSSLLMLLLT